MARSDVEVRETLSGKIWAVYLVEESGNAVQKIQKLIAKLQSNSDKAGSIIRWRVLEVSDGSALIVSQYALDARAYNKSLRFASLYD